MHRTTLVFTTIERVDEFIRLIESFRALCPDVPVLVGEQIAVPGRLADFCRRSGVDYMRLPYDCGLPFARNRLVERLTTDYFMLADDDFVFAEAPDLAFCESFLDANPDFICLGGDLNDYQDLPEGRQALKRFRSYNIVIDERGGGVIKIPTAITGSEAMLHGGQRVTVCDYVPNWGVFRKAAIVDRDLWWDERFVTDGEHLDFFLRVKLEGKGRVAFWDRLLCDHCRTRGETYRQLRRRKDWVDQFRAQWPFRYLHDIGRPIHFLDDYAMPVVLEDGMPVMAGEPVSQGWTVEIATDPATRKRALALLKATSPLADAQGAAAAPIPPDADAGGEGEPVAVEADFIAAAYADLLAGMGDAARVYRAFRDRPWMFPTLAAAIDAGNAARAGEGFERRHYRRTAGIDASKVDVAVHYAIHGQRCGIPGAPRHLRRS